MGRTVSHGIIGSDTDEEIGDVLQKRGDARMSGHSKWATIKRKKEATDSKRGQLFTKLSREIQVAAREGGGDAEMNFRLRLAVQRAKAEGMPAENITRAIARGSGQGGGGAAYEEMIYEGYGPAGTALMVQALTDNRNRTVADVRSIFTRFGGNLGESGSVAWMFDVMGLITVELGPNQSAEDVELQAIDAGAQDVKAEEEVVEVYTDFTELKAVEDALRAQGLNIVTAERTMVPKTMISVDGDKVQSNLKMIDRLEELDDVQQVYTNLELSEEQVAALS
jgi:YebC/PmpR family DNA-binding regulatory protein